MSNDKSLRDIWETTDKKSLEVMKESGGMPPSSASSTITDFSVAPTGLFQQNTKQRKSNPMNIDKPLLPEVPYFKKESSSLEDDTASLVSIWTPTDKDKLAKHKEDKEELLIDFDTIPDVSSQNKTDFTAIVKDKGINQNSKKQCLLLDFDAPEETTTQNMQEFPKHDSDDEISESELSNNYGSDESQDESNNKSVLKYTALPKQYRHNRSESSSSSEHSDITIKCTSTNKELKKENAKSKTDSVLKKEEKQLVTKNIETNKQKLPDVITENTIKQNHKQNCVSLQSKYNATPKSPAYNNGYHKPTNSYGKYRGKPKSAPNKSMSKKISHLSIDNDDVLSVSHENVTIQERDSTSGKTREKRIAFKTQEVIGKKGNRTQKITYVQGKIIEEADSSNKNTLKWNSNICDVKLQNKETVFHSYVPKFRYSENNSPNYEYVSNCEPLLKDSKSLNFYRSYIQPRQNAISKGSFPNKNRSLGHNKFESNNIKHYSQNQRQTKKEVVAISGERVMPNKSYHADKNIFDEKINSIVLCNEKYKKQQQLAKEQLSWNVIHSSDDKNSENDDDDEFENKTSPKLVNESNYTDTLPKQVKGENSNQIKNLPNKSRENGFKFKNPKTLQCSLTDNDVTALKQLHTVPKHVIKEKYNGNKGQLERFAFMHNLEVTSQSENRVQLVDKTIDDSILEMERKRSEINCSLMKLKEEKEEKKYTFICLAKEMADLIVGCHRATDVFRSFYVEWVVFRLQSIELLENVLKTIMDTAKRSGHIKTTADIFKMAMDVAAHIPHPTVSLGAKIGSLIGSFASKIFGQGDKDQGKKEIVEKEFEVKETFQKDIDTTSYVYIYGVQCSTQFEETTQIISELHRKIRQDTVETYFSDKHVLEFLKEISEYNVGNVSVFYRRLMLEYERLMKNSQSDESRAFIRVFKDVPDALSIIELLPWRFDPDGFDNSIVNKAWENLFTMFCGPVNMDELVRKIQSCLFFLKKEKTILERNFKAFSN